MLKTLEVPYRYREVRKEPLSAAELREVLGLLGVPAKTLLRSRDARAAGLTGDEGDEALIAAMAGNPDLIERPIFVLDGKAVIGRPVENVRAIL